MADQPRNVWVFGCFDYPGHFLRDHHRHVVALEVPYKISVACDEALHAPDQTEGARSREWVRNFGGTMWSYYSWWDRQGDSRSGSHTGILARGEWTPAQLVAAGRALVPWAFRVEVPHG